MLESPLPAAEISEFLKLVLNNQNISAKQINSMRDGG